MNFLKIISISLLMTTTAMAQNNVGNPPSGYNCNADDQSICQPGSESDQSSASPSEPSEPSDDGRDSPTDSDEGDDTGPTGTDAT